MSTDIILNSQYWLKLCLYCDHHVKNALLNVLHNVYNNPVYQGLPSDSNQLYNELRNHHVKLKKLKDKKILSNDEWDLLFPTDQQTISEDFDISLIVLLLINCTNLPAPKGGWKQKYPQPSDHSTGAFCLRARQYRNFVKHYGNPTKLQIGEFSAKWAEGDVILTGLGYTGDTSIMKQQSLDPQRVDYFRFCLTHLQNGQDKLQQLVDANTTDVSNMKELAADVIETKATLADLKQHIDDRKCIDENEKIVLHDIFVKYHNLNSQHEDKFKELDGRVDQLEANLLNKQEDVSVRLSALELGTGSVSSFHYFWNVYQNVSNFTGREYILSEIKAKLNVATKYSYSAVALTGLGGIGKTETAARYVHYHGKLEYDNVFWIEADTLERSLLQLAATLKIDHSDKSTKVLSSLISDCVKNARCLFVFDNVENLQLMRPVLQNLNINITPHIIITSQYHQWSGLGITQIEMDVFSNEEALLFFEQFLNTERDDVVTLIEELQLLPLAMQQGLSYINKHSISVREYLDAFRAGRKQLLQINLSESCDSFYDKTLLTVWQMALDKLKLHEYDIAIDVINMMSYMDGNFINAKTFLFHEDIPDKIALNEIIGMLCEYSLISKKKTDLKQTVVVTIHRLVQKIIKLYNEVDLTDDHIKENLVRILCKASELSQNWDIDDEEVWFIHLKTFYLNNKLGNIPLEKISEVGCSRGEMDFVNTVNFDQLKKGISDGLDISQYLNTMYRQVQVLKSKGEVEDAIKFMDEVSSSIASFINVKNIPIILWKLRYALSKLVFGDKKKGVAVYNEVKNCIGSVKDENSEVYIELLKCQIHILYKMKKNELAFRVADKCYQLCFEKKDVTHCVNILCFKAQVLVKLHRLDEAVLVADHIESLFKQFNVSKKSMMNCYYNFTRAEILFEKGQYDESLDILLEIKSIKLENDFSKFCVEYDIGMLYFKKGEYLKALSSINCAICYIQNPRISFETKKQCILLKGLALVRVNQISEAIIVFEEMKDKILRKKKDIAFVSCLLNHAYMMKIMLDCTRKTQLQYGSSSTKFSTVLNRCRDTRRALTQLIQEHLTLLFFYKHFFLERFFI